SRTFGHCVENRLEIAGRGRDDALDLACCRLLLERLGQLAGARIELLGQVQLLSNQCRAVSFAITHKALHGGYSISQCRRSRTVKCCRRWARRSWTLGNPYRPSPCATSSAI